MPVSALLNFLPLPVRKGKLAHDKFFSSLARREFRRLQVTGDTYLDFTGGGLYAASQIQDHQKRLLNGVFGNPHSTNPTSMAATKAVAEARQKVLDFFNAEDYYCIFTPNASGALKLVGESFPWKADSAYLALADNHNSVNGIREFCCKAGGKTTYVPVRETDLLVDETVLLQHLTASCGRAPKLFAYPAQSNVSGVKHSLKWVEEAANRGWSTLLDAAAFAPTNRLDLKACRPDFVSLSFYKIFGYPTGIGCLLVRKDCFGLLRKPWFAGGTVRLAAVGAQEYRLHNDHERYEDGTINYLDLPAITTGLNFIESIGIDRITERISSLGAYLCREMRALHHADGRPIVRIFGPEDRSSCGGNLIFSVFDKDGRWVHYEEVEDRASKLGISIRSGCFCNPGLDEINHDILGKELEEYFITENGDNHYEMIAKMGKLRGATRVSVGVATTQKDLDTFISFLKSWEG